MQVMKKYYLLYAAAFVLTTASALAAQTTAAGREGKAADAHHFHVALPPDSIRWKPFYEGAEIAVLAGDPAAAGSHYVIRIRHRDGLRVPPHWHSFDEQLTIISGTWVMGMGERFDLSAAQEFPAGSYLVSPKRVPHFALSKGETVVQVHGVGPFDITFVNPEEDVFRKAK
jgi:mannose-6-phosphate isomerase-like protein (cupin superfamily)